MKPKLVSLLVPCYQGERTLPDFLESLFSQDYPAVELIFSDDGSEDSTGEIFQRYTGRLPNGWTALYLRQEHAGQAAAIALALERATGAYLMWSDADDILLPGAISRKADFLDRHPEYGMVRNNFYYFKEEQDSLIPGSGDAPAQREEFFEGIFRSTIPCLAGTYMMRFSLFLECYPDRKIPICSEGQNLQLILPPCSRSDCGFIDMPLMKYRLHADSHSGRPRSLSEQYYRIERFRDLRKQLLSYCNCDREKYEALADEIFAAQKKEIALRAITEARRKQSEGRNKP